MVTSFFPWCPTSFLQERQAPFSTYLYSRLKIYMPIVMISAEEEPRNGYQMNALWPLPKLSFTNIHESSSTSQSKVVKTMHTLTTTRRVQRAGQHGHFDKEVPNGFSAHFVCSGCKHLRSYQVARLDVWQYGRLVQCSPLLIELQLAKCFPKY